MYLQSNQVTSFKVFVSPPIDYITRGQARPARKSILPGLTARVF